MSELKACAHCGHEAQPIRYEYKNGEIQDLAYCPNDDCPMHHRTLSIEAWQTRPIEDALNARIAELEAENAELKERIAMLDTMAVFKSLGEMGYIEQVTTLNARIAELEAELKITDELLKEATEAIGAVVACCTYNSNDDAKIGIYGIDQKAFTRIDRFITHYNDAVSAGKVSVDVKTSTDNNKGCEG